MAKSEQVQNTSALRLLTATPEKIREESVDGREFLVVPVVALTEGVFQCANCPQPELYLAQEFGRVVDAWNGRPVTLGHPKRGGRFVSAGSMAVRRKDVVGDIQNARVDGDKLKVEAWIDLEMVAQLGSRAQEQVERLEEGQQVEVSVGAFIDREPMVGSFKGRDFGAVQRNFVPDHLAILPESEIGACSWEDGCGSPRINAKTLAANCDGNPTCSCNGPTLAADQLGDRTKREMLRTALREKLGNRFFTILQVFDDHVVFESETGETVKREFTIDEGTGTVTLSDNEERGTLVSEFMPITVQKGNDEMDRNTAVDQLIANAATPWAEDDRETLLAMSDGSFAKLDTSGDDDTTATGANGTEATTEPAANAGADTADAVLTAANAAAVAMLTKAADGETTEASATKPVSLAEYIDAAPEALQAPLKDMVTVAQRERARLIDILTKNPRCSFNTNQLKEKGTDELRSLVHLATPPAENVRQADFSGRQPVAASAGGKQFMPVPDAPKFNQAAK